MELWASDGGQEYSSNLNEFENLVFTFEKEVSDSNLENATVFLRTANSTVKRMFYRVILVATDYLISKETDDTTRNRLNIKRDV